MFSALDRNFAGNIDPNNNFGVWVQVLRKKSKYKISQKILNNEKVETNNNSVQIVPSKAYPNPNKDKKIMATLTNSRRYLQFTCLDENDHPVNGCKIDLDVALRPGDLNNGGHAHNEPNRPLGKLFKVGGINEIGYPQFDLDIPSAGLNLVYESPEVAGVVTMSLAATDPLGNPIAIGLSDTDYTVRINEDLVSINDNSIEGFKFDLTRASHPGNGFYLTQKNHDKLSDIVSLYRTIAMDKDVDNIPETNIITLKSQGASLLKSSKPSSNCQCNFFIIEHFVRCLVV